MDATLHRPDSSLACRPSWYVPGQLKLLALTISLTISLTITLTIALTLTLTLILDLALA